MNVVIKIDHSLNREDIEPWIEDLLEKPYVIDAIIEHDCSSCGSCKTNNTSKYTIDDLRQAFIDGGNITMFSDEGFEKKYNSFEDWFNEKYI